MKLPCVFQNLIFSWSIQSEENRENNHILGHWSPWTDGGKCVGGFQCVQAFCVCVWGGSSLQTGHKVVYTHKVFFQISFVIAFLCLWCRGKGQGRGECWFCSPLTPPHGRRPPQMYCSSLESLACLLWTKCLQLIEKRVFLGGEGSY